MLVVTVFFGYITRILHYNRSFILVFWGFSVTLIFLYHVLVEYVLKFFRIKGFNLRKILIVGSGELAKKSALKFLEHREFGLNVIGFVTHSKQSITHRSGLPVLGTYEQLRQIVLQEFPDIVYFALPAKEERLTRILIEKINNEPVDIKVALDIDELFLVKNSISEIDGIPIITLRESRMIGFQEILKRMFDIIFALIIILIATPFCVLIAILIKIFSDRSGVLLSRKSEP